MLQFLPIPPAFFSGSVPFGAKAGFIGPHLLGPGVLPISGLSRRRQTKVSVHPLPKGGGFQRQSLWSLIAMSEIPLLPGRRIDNKPSLLSQPTRRPSPSFPLSPSHPPPSPPLPTANRPKLHLGPVSSVPAPTGGFLALPQGSERPIGASPYVPRQCQQGSLGGRRTLRMPSFSHF